MLEGPARTKYFGNGWQLFKSNLGLLYRFVVCIGVGLIGVGRIGIYFVIIKSLGICSWPSQDHRYIVFILKMK